jgi:hypothetical protein
MENIYTEEPMVLLDGTDHIMACHEDITGDVNVQVKQEDMDDIMSVRDATPCPSPKASPWSYSTPPNLTPSSMAMLPATSSRTSCQRDIPSTQQDGPYPHILSPVSPMAPPLVPPRASLGPNQACSKMACSQPNTKPFRPASTLLHDDDGDMVLIPRAELYALEREVAIRRAMQVISSGLEMIKLVNMDVKDGSAGQTHLPHKLPYHVATPSRKQTMDLEAAVAAMNTFPPWSTIMAPGAGVATNSN